MDEPTQTMTERPPRRWTRRPTGRWVAGVAGGIADHADVPTWVVRLGFVLSLFLGGLGIWSYLFLWWIMPRRDLPESAAQRLARRFPQAPMWLGVGLLLLGGLLFAGQLGWVRPPVLAAVALIGLGVLLYLREPADRAATRASVAATTPGRRPTMPLPAVPGETDLPPASLPVVPRRRRRPPSFLGPLTLGFGLVAIGTGALLDLAGVVSFTIAQASALLLLILGIGLMVGGFIGRARWLILPLLLVAPIALVSSVLHIDLNQGIGERSVVVPAAGGAMEARLGVGDLTVDLTHLDAGASATVHAELGAGQLTLEVPDDVAVQIEGRVGLGTVEIFRGRVTRQGYMNWSGGGPEVGGFDRSVVWTSGPRKGGTLGLIHIVADVSVGTIHIVHVDRGSAR